MPYPLVLSLFVAILDLVPVIGSNHRGRGGMPDRAERVAARLPGHHRVLPDLSLVTVVAVLLGGALPGIVGALVTIPAAAALLLPAQEVLFPRLDHT